jgi:NADH-quinone oxidoreductase subunit G
MPGANSTGAALLAPDAGSVEEIAGEIEGGRIRALLTVESDPFWTFPDQPRLQKALAKLDFLLVLDYLPSRTGEMAHVFIPTASLFETESSFINQEGRLQFARPVYSGGSPVMQVSGGGHPPRTFGAEVPGGEPRPAWKILAELEKGLSGQGIESFEPTPQGLWEWMAGEIPLLAGVKPFGSPEGVRLLGERKGGDSFPSRVSASASSFAEDGLNLFCVEWTFGTEELSCYSRFAQQAEKSPCLFLHAGDAARLGLGDKDRVRIELKRGSLEVEVSTAENMAAGVMILPRHRRLSWQVMRELPARVTADKIKKI